MKSPTHLGVLFWVLVAANAFSQQEGSEAGGEGVSGPEGIEGVQAVVGLEVARGSVVVEQNFTSNQVMQSNISEIITLEKSFNQAGGIINVNQSAGNLNAQSNVRLITMGENLSGNPLITVARSAVYAGNVVNGAGAGETSIQDSFNDTVGLVGINQSSGSLNQQVNIAVLSLGALVGPDAITIGDTTLKNVNAHMENHVDDDQRMQRSNALTNSFHGFRGIAQIQQAAGDGNSTANMLGLSVSIMDLP